VLALDLLSSSVVVGKLILDEITHVYEFSDESVFFLSFEGLSSLQCVFRFYLSSILTHCLLDICAQGFVVA
jgi:hypothetical protein